MYDDSICKKKNWKCVSVCARERERELQGSAHDVRKQRFFLI